MHHFLWDRGFLVKVPPSWRELHARGRKLQGAGVPREAVAQRLGVNQSRWEEIERACSVGVVPLGEQELGQGVFYYKDISARGLFDSRSIRLGRINKTTSIYADHFASIRICSRDVRESCVAQTRIFNGFPAPSCTNSTPSRSMAERIASIVSK